MAGRAEKRNAKRVVFFLLTGMSSHSGRHLRPIMPAVAAKACSALFCKRAFARIFEAAGGANAAATHLLQRGGGFCWRHSHRGASDAADNVMQCAARSACGLTLERHIIFKTWRLGAH